MKRHFKKILTIVSLLLAVVEPRQAFSQKKFSPTKAIQQAGAQYRNAVQFNADSVRFPRSVHPNGSLRNVASNDWCSGFFAGSLWLLYELNKDSYWKMAAEKWTTPLVKEQYNTSTHDLGFIIYNSFGNGYRLSSNNAYKSVILQAAKSLSSRFRASTGVIRSWNHGAWQFPVIIDNMMNLELLFEASILSGDRQFKEIAIQHADHTVLNHFRKDFSSYHVVDYDSITGLPIKKQTHQGFNDESAWARGQAWGLYGFTMMYRYTRDVRYLEQAQQIAAFILKHPNLPANKVPYWDFNDPAIPDSYRDASAAAIIASALLELSDYAAKKQSRYYFEQAELLLTSLSSKDFTAPVGTNNNFILQHCVGNLPSGRERGEVDSPINYADYYYLEALLRYKKREGRF